MNSSHIKDCAADKELNNISAYRCIRHQVIGLISLKCEWGLLDAQRSDNHRRDCNQPPSEPSKPKAQQKAPDSQGSAESFDLEA